MIRSPLILTSNRTSKYHPPGEKLIKVDDVFSPYFGAINFRLIFRDELAVIVLGRVKYVK